MAKKSQYASYEIMIFDIVSGFRHQSNKDPTDLGLKRMSYHINIVNYT